MRQTVTAALARPLLASVLGLIPVAWLMAMPGWPINHEMLRLFHRVGVFTGQWSLGHWLPVWSSSAFGGLGSPSPIIYHKVFNVLSTSLYLLTGAPKTAICLSVVLVLATACLGAFRATRVLLGEPNLAIETASGLLLAFSTYTTTDWLTRGALAELCALAGVAWLFAWCLTLIRQGRFSLWIGPLMAAICLSHAAIGLFCALPIGIAVLVAAPIWRAAWLGWCRNAAISLACTTALLAPALLASRAYAGWSNLHILAFGMAAGGNHVALSRLLHETVWHWGDAPFDLTLQIDPLLLAFGAGTLVLACATSRVRPEAMFLLATTAAAIALQSDAAEPLFRAIPTLYWLQFTFRLQTFTVVALALCGALVLYALRPRLGNRGLALLLAPIALAMSAGKPWLGGHPATLFYTDLQVQAALHTEADAPESGEYRPHAGATPSGPACLGRSLDDMSQERAKARFTLACGAEAAVLPVYLAPGMKLRVNGTLVTPYRTCNDARVHIPAPADGAAELIYPTWPTAVGASLGLAPAYTCKS